VGKTTLWLAGGAAALAHGHKRLETRPAEPEAGFAFAGLPGGPTMWTMWRLAT
jgi:hypothetical protein